MRRVNPKPLFSPILDATDVYTYISYTYIYILHAYICLTYV